MILYTILPPEAIFPQSLPETRMKRIDGRLCQCIKTETGYQVERLISTDLRDYLRPEFAPGAKAAGSDENAEQQR